MSIAKHTTYNLIGTIVPLLVSLATIPLYLDVVGAERFGVLSICWLLLGYLGLFDLGLGRAVSQKIACLAESTGHARSEVFWAGFFVSFALMLLGVVVMAFVAEPTLRLMKFDDAAVRQEVSAAAPWLAAALPVSLLAGIFNGALIGRERFGLINKVEVVSGSLLWLTPLALAWVFDVRLWVLVAATLAAKLVGALWMFVACFSAIPLFRPKLPKLDLVKSLIAFGGWVTASSLVGPLLAYWDRLAIGWMIGAAEVSLYVVPFILVSRLVTIPGALSRAMFPRFAASSGDDNRALQANGMVALSALITPGALLLILLVGPFLQFWVGTDIAEESARVAYLLIPGMWMNGIAQIAHSLLHANGRPSVVAKIHLAEILPYVALLYAGMLLFGIEGAALVWSLRATADAVLLFWFSDTRLSNLKRLLPSWMIVVGAAGAGLLFPPSSPTSWVVLGGMMIVGLVFVYSSTPKPIKLAVLNKLQGMARA